MSALTEALEALQAALNEVESQAGEAESDHENERDELVSALAAARDAMSDMGKVVATVAARIRKELEGEVVDCGEVEDALIDLENEAECLDSVHDDTETVIKEHSPDEVAA